MWLVGASVDSVARTSVLTPYPFFICDCSTPYFGSLNKEQLERYKKQFQNPERFFRVGGEIKAVPYKPEKGHER